MTTFVIRTDDERDLGEPGWIPSRPLRSGRE